MANREFNPNEQYADDTGLPYAGGFLYFYASESSTPLATYSDPDLDISHVNTNPVELDAAGRAGAVFLQNLPYKVILKDADLNTIWTEDPVYSSDYSTVAQFQVYAGSPNGNVAGTAGTGSIPSSVVWDNVHDILYVATTTGTAVTAVWTAVNASTAAAVVPAPQGRLTLTSGVPVTTSNVTGATAVYYTPYIGATIPIYTGAAFTPTTFSELTLTLVSAHAANTNYDIFVFNNSGILTLVTGPAWSSRTARGTGAGTTELTTISGLLVNNVQITGRNSSSTYTVAANKATYLGTFSSTSAAGQTEDSTSNRLLWNTYSRRPRPIYKTDATASWNYSTAAWRQANGSTANQTTVIIGLSEDAVRVEAIGETGSSVAGNVFAGVGLDTTSANSATLNNNGTIWVTGIGGAALTRATYNDFPNIGYHYFAWLEYGCGSGTQTWYGTTAAGGPGTQGLSGTVWA